jgi:hypothetical protein
MALLIALLLICNPLLVVASTTLGRRARHWPAAAGAGAAIGSLCTGIFSALMFFTTAYLAFPAGLVVGAPLGMLWGLIGYGLHRRLNRRAQIIGAGTYAIIVIAVVVHLLVTPFAQTAVPWPDRSIGVRIQIWGLRSAAWWVEVRTPNGRLALALWEDWGPVDRANIYRTARGSVAVIGGGFLSPAIEFPTDAPPRLGTPGEVADASDWVYLGAVVQQGGGGLLFRPPSELRECIPLHGIGSVSVRKEFQAASALDCPGGVEAHAIRSDGRLQHAPN